MLIPLLKCALLGCKHQERVTFGGKVEVLGQWTLRKEACIVLHFQQVVLTVGMLELDVYAVLPAFLLLLLVDMQEMFPPPENTFHNI